jgi:hypothetical protein
MNQYCKPRSAEQLIRDVRQHIHYVQPNGSIIKQLRYEIYQQ